VLAVFYKVAHEIDRLMGFLRFSPVEQVAGSPARDDVTEPISFSPRGEGPQGAGRYIARCAPDHFVLPALAFHFTKRFGETSWAIIDERRGLALVREDAGEPRIIAPGGCRETRRGLHGQAPAAVDPWENLWRSYHRTINIESRKNPRLQRQFMPLRYRPYLTEFNAEPNPLSPDTGADSPER
jgi:probable DNA metabolism protein